MQNELTTDEFKKLLAGVDWYYHYLERGYMDAQRNFSRVKQLAHSKPEWLDLWTVAKPSN